jgi:WD40 repeat protein
LEFTSAPCFSPDNNKIICGTRDNMIRIWDLKAEKNIKILVGHSQNVLTLSYFKDGKKIISGS